jgi:hypothetical protein
MNKSCPDRENDMSGGKKAGHSRKHRRIQEEEKENKVFLDQIKRGNQVGQILIHAIVQTKCYKGLCY